MLSAWMANDDGLTLTRKRVYVGADTVQAKALLPVRAWSRRRRIHLCSTGVSVSTWDFSLGEPGERPFAEQGRARARVDRAAAVRNDGIDVLRGRSGAMPRRIAAPHIAGRAFDAMAGRARTMPPWLVYLTKSPARSALPGYRRSAPSFVDFLFAP
jgi:hypothetical protein